MLEEAGTAAALVEQHYLPALKAQGCAANGCIIAAVDSAALLAVCLAAHLMQLYPAHPPTSADPFNIVTHASPPGRNLPSMGLHPDAVDSSRPAAGAESVTPRPSAVEALVLIQSPRLQGLAVMAQQPWFRAKDIVRATCPHVDMRSFAAEGVRASQQADHGSQMVGHQIHPTISPLRIPTWRPACQIMYSGLVG